MNPNVIQFACGHCQSWLTVPAHMAGVAGPCPKCGNHIVSPQATVEPAAAAAGNWAPAENPMPQASGQPPPQWPGAGLHQPQPQQEPYPQAAQLPPRQAAAPQNEFFPPAPAAAPMVPPPMAQASWGQPAAQGNPDNGLPGGYPLHTQGLRPNAGMTLPPARNTALPPPIIGQQHPQPGMQGQLPMPGQMPAAAGMMGYDPSSQTGGLTRPASVGGSRLSLLARQLTTPAEGAPGLPMAPASLPASELPGQAPMAYNAPAASWNQQSGDMMKQNMSKGLMVGRSQSGGKTKFALVALLLIGLLGALVWQYRAPIQDIVAQVFPPTPALPEITAPDSTSPVPGVDKVGATTSATVTSRPDTTPPPTTIPAPDDRPMVARAEPVSLRQEVKAGTPVPPEEAPVETTPMAPKTTKESLELMATINAPRAKPVDDDDGIKPPVPPAPDPTPGNPLTGSPQGMVEVGRTNTDPKISQNATPAPSPTLGTGQPSVKNVPPACKPALDGLMSFLNARNWRDRMKFIQLPEQMESKLKLYYGSNPDGPIDVDEIQYLRHDESPQVGRGLHAVFVLFSRNWEYGFPVMVEVTPDGARVDWLTFIEFKDDMLNKFLSNYMEERVQFHVGIHRTHYFDDNIPGLDQKEQFSVTSPMANVRGFVFAPKGTPFARSLASTISWDKEASWVVVELQWRKEGSAKWVEMTALPQLNWYSAGADPAKAAPASASVPPPPAPKGSTAR